MMATTWVDSKIGFAYIEIDASTAERKKQGQRALL
jgi:hypothetical protein